MTMTTTSAPCLVRSASEHKARLAAATRRWVKACRKAEAAKPLTSSLGAALKAALK